MSSSSSPLKSSSSDKKSSSEVTTTVPEVSSASSSTTKSEIVELKKKLDLLKTQLKQRDKELERQKWERLGTETDRYSVRSEINTLQAKSNALSAICSDLMKLIETNEIEEQKRQEVIENLYKTNLHSVTETSNRLKDEVGKLRQQLSGNEAKISAVIHENSYLRWENEALAVEVETLKKRLQEEVKTGKEMKAEITELRQTHRLMERNQGVRRDVEVTNVVASTAAQLESARRAIQDREKEYGITLSRLQNELGFLREELKRKEEQTVKLTAMLDDLVDDNKRLYGEQTKLRRLYEQTACELYAARKEGERLEQEREEQNVELKTGVKTPKRTTLGVLQERVTSEGAATELAEARTQIRHLRTLIDNMKTVADTSNVGTLRNQLREHQVQAAKLENTIQVLKKERDEERAQRENTTVILLEMTADLKSLLSAVKGSDF